MSHQSDQFTGLTKHLMLRRGPLSINLPYSRGILRLEDIGFFLSSDFIWCQTLHGVRMMNGQLPWKKMQTSRSCSIKHSRAGDCWGGWLSPLPKNTEEKKKVYFWICNVVVFVVFWIKGGKAEGTLWWPLMIKHTCSWTQCHLCEYEISLRTR